MDELLKGYSGPEDLIGPNGLLKELTSRAREPGHGGGDVGASGLRPRRDATGIQVQPP